MIVNNLEHELESNQIHCVRCDNFSKHLPDQIKEK